MVKPKKQAAQSAREMLEPILKAASGAPRHSQTMRPTTRPQAAPSSKAVPASREGRRSRTLEVEVTNGSIDAGDFAEQQRAAVAQPRDEPAELVSGVGLRHRRGTAGDQGADQEPHPFGASQPVRLQAEVGGQPLIEHQQPRVGSRLGLPAHSHLR